MSRLISSLVDVSQPKKEKVPSNIIMGESTSPSIRVIV